VAAAAVALPVKGHTTRADAERQRVKPDELDLHGMTVEQAIPLLEPFLSRSAKARRHRVWIFHGKGTGTPRSAVRSYLKGRLLV